MVGYFSFFFIFSIRINFDSIKKKEKNNIYQLEISGATLIRHIQLQINIAI